MESVFNTLQIVVGAITFAYGMLMHARVTRGGADITERYIFSTVAMIAGGAVLFGFGVS